MFKDRGKAKDKKQVIDKKAADKKGAVASKNSADLEKESLLWGISALNEKNFEPGLNFVKKVCKFLEENKGKTIHFSFSLLHILNRNLFLIFQFFSMRFLALFYLTFGFVTNLNHF